MAEKVTTKAPTGLTITRNGAKFTFAWKIGDKDYKKGQQLQYHLSNLMKTNVWADIPINVGTTSKVYTVDMSKYYPTTEIKMQDIHFRVRGCRGDYSTGTGAKKKDYKPTWSEWTTKFIKMDVPNVPSMTVEWDSEHANETTFTWNTVTSAEGSKHFRNVELQSIIVKGCTATDGSRLSWKTTTTGWVQETRAANDSRKFIEDSAITEGNESWTRWVRVRSRGARGASAWRYAKHVYAHPLRAVVKNVKVLNTAAAGYNATITWDANQTPSRPIDETKVEYVFATPDNNLACPDGLTWTLAETLTDTRGADKANFEIDDRVDLDECLWLRVNAHHDNNVNHGIPQLAVIGKLTDPDNLDAEPSAQNYTATVSADNNSSVPDSFLVVLFRRQVKQNNKWVWEKNPMIVGIMPHGTSEITVNCPNWGTGARVSFGVYAAQGSWTRDTSSPVGKQYKVTANTTSKTIWETEDVPKAPETVTLAETSTPGKVKVSWSWSWASADTAEISWSDDPNAWQSTAGFNSYKTENKTTYCYIPDLEMGKKWYVRVRLYDEDNVSPWSVRETIDLATTPVKPVLTLSEGRITTTGNITCSWTYSSRDGMPQSYAEVRECTINGETITYGGLRGRTESSQAVIIYADTAKWRAGTTHYLTVRTTSGSGKKSEWSDPVPVNIATPLTCTIAQTSLETITVVDDEDESITREVLALTEMPLTLTVTGAGVGGTTSVYIERAETYHMERPDETDFNGYEGEAVAVFTQNGEAEITIDNIDLLGSLDDGANYRIVATVSDDLGQSDRSELGFQVWWDHQAIVPSATVVVDDENYVVKITPIAPTGTVTGDTCDIYRLSADRPELIVTEAEFGETYVDPYPALGEHGGHRIVFISNNGDYITETNQPAWIDYGEVEGDILDYDTIIIDFAGEHCVLPYNIELSSAWRKDFLETHYLGGAVQGDWNKAVSRTGSMNTSTVAIDDPEVIRQMRKLAAYPGICHVRTPEGSSFAADVQVNESMSYEQAGKIAEFSISVTRVDPENLDGMTLAEWEVEQ